VVDEDEVDRSVGETELAPQSVDGRSAVSERSHDHGQPLAYARVSPDAAGDLSVRRVELERAQPGIRRHHPGHPQPAVAAIRPQLKQKRRRDSLNGLVKDLALLVAHVHHHAACHAEVVDDPDRVIEVAGTSVSDDVGGQGFLAPVTHLPVPRQAPHAEEHAQNRPPQERKSPAPNLT